MKNTFRIVFLACLALFLLFIIRLIDPQPVQIIRAATFDYYQRVLPKEVEKFPISIIDIDEKSLTEIGQWPWPRSILAELLEKLSALQPLVIGFDMVFPESDRLSPSSIVNLLPKETSRLILDRIKLSNSDEELVKSFVELPIVLGTMLNNSVKVNQAGLLKKSQIEWSSNPTKFLPVFSTRTANLKDFETAAKGVGVFTLLPEVDGVVRRVPTLFNLDNEILPAFGLEILRVALADESVNVEVDQAGIDSITTGGITIPTNQRGLTWVQFNQHQKTRFISAVDILKDRVDENSLSGHIFLIGTSASGLLDIKMTPMAQQMPGVEIWAQWLESALFGKLLERPNYAFIAEVLFLVGFGLLLIFLTVKASARLSFCVYFGLTLLCIGFSWWMYSRNYQLFDFTFPVLSAGVLFAFLMLMKFWHEEQQRKQIKNAFSHYLSPSIVDELAANPDQLKLGGESREITSLFTDLQGFTELSEAVEPEQLVSLINRYLDGICHVVINHGGTIDKIIGDAIHAIFGAPKHDSEHADNAVSCALKIDEFCRQFKINNSNKFKFGDTRIGVSSGLAVVGNFGGEQRFDYTAYGDVINTAARIESANQYLGTTISISELTKNLCEEHEFRPIADLTVKGKSGSLMVYEPLTQGSEVSSYLDRYCDVFADLKHKKSNAVLQLKELNNDYPQDMVIKVLLDHVIESNSISVERVLSEK